MGISFTRNTGIAEKRRCGRPPLGIEASLRERGRSSASVRVTDLSPYGCRISGYMQVSPDAQTWIKLPGLASQAVRTIWSDGAVIGLEFDPPLHPAVAARYMPTPGSHAANDDWSRRVADPLLSRREQIMAGIVSSDLSPLQMRKNRTRLGMLGRITRTIKRSVDHRAESRYGEGLEGGPREVLIGGARGQITNVSPSGLRLELDEIQDWSIGKKLNVEFPDCPPITARLVWLNGCDIGVSLPPQAIDLCDTPEG